MQHNQLENLFGALPTEIQKEVFDRLPTVKDKSALTRVAKPQLTLFQSTIDEEHFLHHVKEASYRTVAALARENPALIFKPLGDELISPLVYAFKVYDTYMWQLFETIISEKCPHLLPTFDAMFVAQTDFINLDALRLAYQTFEAVVREVRVSYGDAKMDHLMASFNVFIKAQRQFIPAHMLYEFTRYDSVCESNSAFDAPKPSEACSPHNRDIPPTMLGGKVHERIFLLPYDKANIGTTLFGRVCGVYRNIHSAGAWVARSPFEFFNAVDGGADFSILQRIFIVRQSQFVARRAAIQEAQASKTPNPS